MDFGSAPGEEASLWEATPSRALRSHRSYVHRRHHQRHISDIPWAYQGQDGAPWAYQGSPFEAAGVYQEATRGGAQAASRRGQSMRPMGATREEGDRGRTRGERRGGDGMGLRQGTQREVGPDQEMRNWEGERGRLSQERHREGEEKGRRRGGEGEEKGRGRRDQETLDLRILSKRLQLLQNQRQLAALHCERFTLLLERSLDPPTLRPSDSPTTQSQAKPQNGAAAEPLTVAEAEPLTVAEAELGAGAGPVAGVGPGSDVCAPDTPPQLPPLPGVMEEGAKEKVFSHRRQLSCPVMELPGPGPCGYASTNTPQGGALAGVPLVDKGACSAVQVPGDTVYANTGIPQVAGLQRAYPGFQSSPQPQHLRPLPQRTQQHQQQHPEPYHQQQHPRQQQQKQHQQEEQPPPAHHQAGNAPSAQDQAASAPWAHPHATSVHAAYPEAASAHVAHHQWQGSAPLSPGLYSQDGTRSQDIRQSATLQRRGTHGNDHSRSESPSCSPGLRHSRAYGRSKSRSQRQGQRLEPSQSSPPFGRRPRPRGLRLAYSGPLPLITSPSSSPSPSTSPSSSLSPSPPATPAPGTLPHPPFSSSPSPTPAQRTPPHWDAPALSTPLLERHEGQLSVHPRHAGQSGKAQDRLEGRPQWVKWRSAANSPPALASPQHSPTLITYPPPNPSGSTHTPSSPVPGSFLPPGQPSLITGRSLRHPMISTPSHPRYHTGGSPSHPSRNRAGSYSPSPPSCCAAWTDLPGGHAVSCDQHGGYAVGSPGQPGYATGGAQGHPGGYAVLSPGQPALQSMASPPQPVEYAVPLQSHLERTNLRHQRQLSLPPIAPIAPLAPPGTSPPVSSTLWARRRALTKARHKSLGPGQGHWQGRGGEGQGSTASLRWTQSQSGSQSGSRQSMWRDPTHSGLFPRSTCCSPSWEGQGSPQGRLLARANTSLAHHNASLVHGDASLVHDNTSLADAGNIFSDATGRLAQAGGSLPQGVGVGDDNVPRVVDAQGVHSLARHEVQPDSLAHPADSLAYQADSQMQYVSNAATTWQTPHLSPSLLQESSAVPSRRALQDLWRTKSTAMVSQSSTGSALISLGSFVSASSQAPSPHGFPPSASSQAPSPHYFPPSASSQVPSPSYSPSAVSTPMLAPYSTHFSSKTTRVRFQSGLSAVLGAPSPPSESESPLTSPNSLDEFEGRGSSQAHQGYARPRKYAFPLGRPTTMSKSKSLGSHVSGEGNAGEVVDVSEVPVLMGGAVTGSVQNASQNAVDGESQSGLERESGGERAEAGFGVKMRTLVLEDPPSPGSSHSTSSPSPTSWLPTSTEMPAHVLRSHNSVRFPS